MDEKANPIDVEQYLQKTNFPASKNELVNFARGHNAPDLIITALKSIPERQYKNAAEAAKETFFPDEELFRGRDSCDE